MSKPLPDDQYTRPVKFTKTGQYGCGPKGEDDVYTVEEFLKYVKTGAFIDYDGFGYPVKDGKAAPGVWIKPSQAPESIPSNATHIVWFNR